jgi:hypothetical protein
VKSVKSMKSMRVAVGRKAIGFVPAKFRATIAHPPQLGSFLQYRIFAVLTSGQLGSFPQPPQCLSNELEPERPP